MHQEKSRPRCAPHGKARCTSHSSEDFVVGPLAFEGKRQSQGRVLHQFLFFPRFVDYFGVKWTIDVLEVTPQGDFPFF